MNYIKFKKYHIRKDLDSFLIFYNFFLFRPKLKPCILKTIDKVSTNLIKALFKLKLIKLLKSTYIDNEKAIIIRKGVGKEPSCVKLLEKENILVIKKIVSQKELYKTKMFYETYRNTGSSFIFPQHEFHSKNTIEIEFIPQKNLATQIKNHMYGWEQILSIYKGICEQLDMLYNNTTNVLIHGDLTPDNIYYDRARKKIFVIDYGDSHIYEKNFDKYLLLKRIILDYYRKPMINIEKLFFDENQIQQYNNHLVTIHNEKHYTKI